MAPRDDEDDEEIYRVLNSKNCSLVSGSFLHSSTKMFVVEQLYNIKRQVLYLKCKINI
jgi:hypothetical protein